MRPLSEDLRRRIIEARQAGAGSVEVSARFRVSRRTVARLYGQFERSGEVRPSRSAATDARGSRRTAARLTGGSAAGRISVWPNSRNVARRSWESRLGSTPSGTNCGAWG